MRKKKGAWIQIFGRSSRPAYQSCSSAIFNLASKHTYPYIEVKRLFEYLDSDIKKTEEVLNHTSRTNLSVGVVIDTLKAAAEAFKQVGQFGATLEEAKKAIQVLSKKQKKMKKTVKAPEGYKFKNGKTEKAVYPIPVVRPTNLEELVKAEDCKEYYYPCDSGSISLSTEGDQIDSTTRETAEAIQSLTLLIRYRDAWNEGVIEEGYPIFKVRHELVSNQISSMNYPIILKTRELRDEFLKEFRQLLEKTKMFL